MKNSTKLNIFHVIRVAADFKLAMLEKDNMYILSSTLSIRTIISFLLSSNKGNDKYLYFKRIPVETHWAENGKKY